MFIKHGIISLDPSLICFFFKRRTCGSKQSKIIQIWPHQKGPTWILFTAGIWPWGYLTINSILGTHFHLFGDSGTYWFIWTWDTSKSILCDHFRHWRCIFSGPSPMTSKYVTVRCVSLMVSPFLLDYMVVKPIINHYVPFMDDSWRPFLVVEGLLFRVYHII